LFFSDPESANKALSDDSKFAGPSAKQSLLTGEEEKNYYLKKMTSRHLNKLKQRPPKKNSQFFLTLLTGN